MNERQVRSGEQRLGWKDATLLLVITALLGSGLATRTPREGVDLNGNPLYDTPTPTPVYTPTHSYYDGTPISSPKPIAPRLDN